MRYAYQNSGHPALSWKNGPPRQTRGADAAALGGINLVLPRAGAPEPINGLGGCGCGGACAKSAAMGSVVDTIAGLSPAVKIAGLVGVAYLYMKMKKKR